MIRALAGDFCTHGRTVACRPGAGNRPGGRRAQASAPRGHGRVFVSALRRALPTEGSRRRYPMPWGAALCLLPAVRRARISGACREGRPGPGGAVRAEREKSPGKRPSAGAGGLPKLRLWAIGLGPDAQKPRRRRLLTAYAVAIRGKDHEERYPSQGVQRHHYLRLR
ncbi:hypothetical protein DESPIGER_1741 [Desulfovibrio piger]|uniref:Uncharacterized protein n=1 Tax=Desulfovibrio piger TaxID=901 RepID=A0A1K1LFU2_9BACT|nr:hypothetical protein DESPIGER_1741 [Desulfovibrio piger]